LLHDNRNDVRKAAARSLALTVRGLQLLCAQEFPDAPIAIGASRIIGISDSSSFTEKSWHRDFQSKQTLLISPNALGLCQNSVLQNQLAASSSTSSTTSTTETQKKDKGKKKVGF